MRFFRKEIWSYATLLIVLFCIAAIAVNETIHYIDEHISPGAFRIVAALIWSITLGFMMIAGAFGLWAIQFAGESESRRRIAQLVDAMDYLSDGLISVNRKNGTIMGSNPAARVIARSLQSSGEIPLIEAFPCLSKSDEEILLQTERPMEVEHESATSDESVRMLRFRSQPAESVNLILISDITAMNQQRARARQAASLQLIGEIAKGVAHDFNNLLWAISGNASLLVRSRAIPPHLTKAGEAIVNSAERGMVMAGRLLGLAQPSINGLGTHMPAEHIRNASQMLLDSLYTGWQVECSVRKDLPPVLLTGPQIEQVILNVGLLAADSRQQPGTLLIEASPPQADSIFNVGEKYAFAVIVTTAEKALAASPARLSAREISSESGVILSVMKSLLDDVGGLLQELVAADGTPIYRLAFTPGAMRLLSRAVGAPQLTSELKAYIAQWTTLLAFSPEFGEDLADSLAGLGLKTDRTNGIAGMLARIENLERIDVAVIDRQLLGQEARALLGALLKLRTDMGIVVLRDDAELEIQGLSGEIVFAAPDVDASSLVSALVEAKSLALRRKEKRERINRVSAG